MAAADRTTMVNALSSASSASPLGMPGQWSSQATLRLHAARQKQGLVTSLPSGAMGGFYTAVSQQNLGAMGGSQGYRAYVKAYLQAAAKEASPEN